MVSSNTLRSGTARVTRAANAIEALFPDLAPVQIELLAGGEDFHVFLTNGRWVFRFPRRQSSYRKLKREQLLLPLVAATLKRLPVRIPHYEKAEFSSHGFPHSFVGYRVIPGVGADRVAAGKLDQRHLAQVLGRAIGRLHLIPPDVLARAGVPRDPRTPRRVMTQLRARVSAIRQVLPPSLRRSAGNFLSGNVAVPRPYSGPARFIHNDICPDHILVDPMNGRLAGLVDFSDAALGDPALDFPNLYSWIGHDFVLELLRWYRAPRDSEFELRLAFYSRTLSLVWLADTARKGDKADIAKHLRWVRRAFRN